MKAKLQKFSQHFHKSYKTAKLFSCLTFVAYSTDHVNKFGAIGMFVHPLKVFLKVHQSWPNSEMLLKLTVKCRYIFSTTWKESATIWSVHVDQFGANGTCIAIYTIFENILKCPSKSKLYWPNAAILKSCCSCTVSVQIGCY